MTIKDTWNPTQYSLFKEERTRPFYDLAALIQPTPISTAIDLGCGTGELTLHLHKKLNIKSTLGIDRSSAMLNHAFSLQHPGLEFRTQQIENWQSTSDFDLIFSNAALQWVPQHHDLLTKLVHSLKAGGQIAVQMPMNQDHRSHTLAAELSQEKPYSEILKGYQRRFYLLPIEEYATLFTELGLTKINVFMKVYVHTMPSAKEVIEWVKGSLLTGYQARLPDEVFDKFLAEYSHRFIAEFSKLKPYHYAYKRLFLWAMKE